MLRSPKVGVARSTRRLPPKLRVCAVVKVALAPMTSAPPVTSTLLPDRADPSTSCTVLAVTRSRPVPVTWSPVL